MSNPALNPSPAVKCPFCGAEVGVGLEQIIKGSTVVTGLYCRSCQGDWPTVRSAFPGAERRRIPDRRRITRIDRRMPRES